MFISQKKLITISQKTNGRCFYCNSCDATEVDHFISRNKWKEWNLENTPLKGQLNKIKNLFLSCGYCNRSKGSKTPEDFFGNSFKAWYRYFRANRRIGIKVITEFAYE